jgi:hypothetical protein
MLTFYTDRFIPANSAGCARGPVIFIRPKYRDDIGLLRHEECHVGQWWHTLGLHSILYLVSKAYRLKAEVEAYREQLKHPPANSTEEYRHKYSHYISEDYGLSITEDQAYQLLGD